MAVSKDKVCDGLMNMLRILASILLFVFITLLVSSPSNARTPLSSCSPPTKIDLQGFADFALIPHVVSDSYGQLHLFLSAGYASDYPNTNTIIYTVLSDLERSTAVDIFYSEDYASVDDVVLASDDTLIVSWRTRSGQGNDLRISRSHLLSASSAKNWETEIVFNGSVIDSDLFIDNQGAIHLGFLNYEAASVSGSIYYMRSDDNAETWAVFSNYGAFYPATETPRFLSIYAGNSSRVSFAWAINTRESDWSPQSIHYTAYEPTIDVWSEVREVFPGPNSNMPSFLVGAEPGKVYLSWMRGVGHSDSKYIMSSSDFGASWATPQLLFDNLRGMNGPMKMVVDSDNIQYLVMAGDDPTRGGATAIWVSQQDGVSWTQPISISGNLLKQSEFPQAIVLNGNVLYVFWLDWGERAVFYSYCQLASSYLTPQPFSTMDWTNASSDNETNIISSPLTDIEFPTPLPTTVVHSIEQRTSQLEPIVVSTALCFFFIFGVVIIRYRFDGRVK